VCSISHTVFRGIFKFTTGAVFEKVIVNAIMHGVNHAKTGINTGINNTKSTTVGFYHCPLRQKAVLSLCYPKTVACPGNSFV
jgi:hypothetical protein